MIKYISLLFFFFCFFTQTLAQTVTLSTNTPIQWSGVYLFWDNNIFVEKIVFPQSSLKTDTKRVYIDAQELQDDGITPIQWNFWIQSLSTTVDPSLWWVTFNHWVSGSETQLVQSWSSQQYVLKGFAWSKAAGWIYFWDKLNWNKAIYNRTTGTISGYGWSQNIGWIPMWGLKLVTTPPSINLPTIFAADDNKSITITSSSPLVLSTIENHNSITSTTYTSKNFHHNFQTVKPWKYDYEIKDDFENKISGTFHVVANTPETVTPIITSWTKIADGVEKHKIQIDLKDKYNNPVIPVVWVKQVEVEIAFENDVCKNQIDTLVCWWDAISYTDAVAFSSLHYMTNTSTGVNMIDGKYEISIDSLAPTKIAYSPAKWDIHISKLSYKISPLNAHSWVWELAGKVDIYWWTVSKSLPFSFTPAVYVNDINTNPTRIMRDVSVIFDAEIKKPTLQTISNFSIHHILDIGSNLMMSFQWLQKNGTETSVCTGYNSQSWYIENGDCDLSLPSSSSNILLSKSWNLSEYTSSFQTTPKIVALADPNFSTDYDTKISYEISGKVIKYSSLKKTFADLISNQEVKIAWIANNWGYEVSNVSTNKILNTSITKSDLRMQIAKNVETYTKNGIPANIDYKTSNYTLNAWPSGKDTIIIKWWDLIITGNIIKTSSDKLNSIVILRENGVWGNIWIDKNVQFVSAIIYVDGHLLSWNGTTYYSDSLPSQAKDQLFIKWSIISNNTIWGASKNPYVCPYRFDASQSCDEKQSRRYDLNHFRHFISESSFWAGDGVWEKFLPWTGPWEIDVWYDTIDMTNIGYSQAPMIVEYDYKIQTNPPKIFLNK